MKLTLLVIGFVIGYFAFQALWSLLNMWLEARKNKNNNK